MEEEKKLLYNRLLSRAIIMDSRMNYEESNYNKRPNIAGKTKDLEKEKERLLKIAKQQDNLREFKNSDYSRNDWLHYSVDDEFYSTMDYKRTSGSTNSSGHVSATLVSDKYLHPEVYEYNDNNIGNLRNIYFDRK